MAAGNRQAMTGWIIAAILVIALSLNYFLANDNVLLRIPDKRPQGLLDVIWHGPEDAKTVALTFDDGPVPAYTPKILDILKKYHVHATFFVVGQYAESHPEIIHRMVVEGHEVENHTYDHPILTSISIKSMRNEIAHCHWVIGKLTGKEPHFFRPPHEIFDARLIQALKDFPNYDICLWSVALEHHEVKTPKAMADRVLAQDYNGEIILAHDGRVMSNRRTTVAAIPYLIKGFKKKGYSFKTLREMFHLRDIPERNAKTGLNR